MSIKYSFFTHLARRDKRGSSCLKPSLAGEARQRRRRLELSVEQARPGCISIDGMLYPKKSFTNPVKVF